jgi:signal transduction histidine kinase
MTVRTEVPASPEPARRRGLPSDLGDALARLRDAESANLALEREVVQRRMAEELARSQTRMLIRSLGILAAGSNLDTFLGHVLKMTVQQLNCVGGTLWFPEAGTGSIRLHLEYLEGQVVPASRSRHPAVLQPPPVGGKGVSTFPTQHPESYRMTDVVAGMPEENRAYIRSLGVQTLLTVPMLLGRETVGWICVRSRKADPTELEDKIHLAEALANQATLAVQMARLAEGAREAAVLGERNRIARDIHDTLAQGFTGILLNLEAASMTLERSDPGSAAHHVDNARRLARSCLEEARTSVRALRPQTPPEAGLPEALRAQAARLQSGGRAGSFSVVGQAFAIPDEVQAEFTRIAQEGITNVIRHASATRAELALDFGDDTVELTLTDDGRGFDPSRRRDGFGLTGIRERASRIGATIDISSRPGCGARIAVRWSARTPIR